MSKFIDIMGKTFGKLTVISRMSNDARGNAVWNCTCECGNTTNVRGSDLRTGNVKSCGCLHKENTRAVKKKNNIYDLSGDFATGVTFNTNKKFYFDHEDYEKIKEYCWVENDQGYIIARNIYGESPKNIRLHRLVTDFKYEFIDHKNGKKYDNRKFNLRPTSKQTNNINRGVNSNNALGIKGIYFVKKLNTYQAKIQKGNKIYTKNSNDLSYLIEWRQKKEIELYGEYAYKEDNV